MEFVVEKYLKYLVLILLALVIAVGAYHFDLLGNLGTMLELVAWVFIVAGAVALIERIVGKRSGSRT